MAIQKEKILDSGIVADYWRVAREDYDRISGKLTCFLGLFLDSEKYVPVCDFKIFVFDVTEEQMSSNRTAASYDLIKATGDADLDGGKDI